MKTTCLVLILLGCLGCGPSDQNMGEALEKSFSQSAQEKQSRALAEQQKKKIQASQERLQAERLKSYQVDSGSNQ